MSKTVLKAEESPFGDISTLDREGVRGFIDFIQDLCLEAEEQAEIPIAHHFSKSVYAREMKMPKGALVVGKIHKHQTLNIISGGEVSILSIDGLLKVKAPYTFVSSPGAKRMIYSHDDVTWTCVHGTDERDLEKIEDEFIAKNYDEVVYLCQTQKLEGEK